MLKSIESITYLVKVQHAILINDQQCCYDEIIAQCTDLDEAVHLANTKNGKIEKHTEAINNIYDEALELYS